MWVYWCGSQQEEAVLEEVEHDGEAQPDHQAHKDQDAEEVEVRARGAAVGAQVCGPKVGMRLLRLDRDRRKSCCRTWGVRIRRRWVPRTVANERTV